MICSNIFDNKNSKKMARLGDVQHSIDMLYILTQSEVTSYYAYGTLSDLMIHMKNTYGYTPNSMISYGEYEPGFDTPLNELQDCIPIYMMDADERLEYAIL